MLERLKGRKILMERLNMGSAIAQRISLCLPSSRRRFKSQAQHLHFFNSVSNCILNLSSYCEKDKNKQKEAGIGQFQRGIRCLQCRLNISHVFPQRTFTYFHVINFGILLHCVSCFITSNFS